MAASVSSSLAPLMFSRSSKRDVWAARRSLRRCLAPILKLAGQELRSIPTLTQLVRDRYLPHAKANKRSWHIDELNLRLHILPALGRLMLDEITSEHVADMINDMRAKRLCRRDQKSRPDAAPPRLQSGP